MYKFFFKRIIDLIISIIVIVITLPISIGLITVFVITQKEIPFFFQNRPGLNEQIFKLIKFKTMNDKRDINGNLLPDNERLTTLGKFIRKTSLDEIPQLINVIKGEMSLVGPRPLLVEYLQLYDQEQKKRHLVKPGITGWAQVNGRNAISWGQKFKLDVWYVDNQSCFLDLKILMMTFYKVIQSDGINSNSTITMEKFRGNI